MIEKLKTPFCTEHNFISKINEIIDELNKLEKDTSSLNTSSTLEEHTDAIGNKFYIAKIDD